MVIISGSMATPNGLTFTVGQITWTTGSDDSIAMTTEEAWIQFASTTTSPALATTLTTVNTAPTTVNTAPTTVNTAPTTMDLAPTTGHLAPTTPTATPTTRHPLPRYRGKQIDNTDLLDSVDRVGIQLAETLALVSTIQIQPNEQVTALHNRSIRPARTSRPVRLGTDLVVVSTPEGRFAHRRPAIATGLRLCEYEAPTENHQVQPYGLQNAASSYAYNLRRRSDLCPIHRSRPKPCNIVNMVRIEDYQEGSVHTVREGDSSSSSGIASNASVHTELQRHEDEGVKYDLDLPDHAPGFPQFLSFPPR